MAVPTTTPAAASDGAAGPDRPAPYSRVAAFGLLLLAAAPLLLIVVTLLTSGALDGEAMFLVIATALPLVAAVLVWRFGLWAKITGLVVALLAAAGMFWLLFGLAFPASFADFVPGVVFLVGLVLAAGGAIAAIVRRRATGRWGLERRIIGVAGAVVALAVVVSGVLSFMGGESAAGVDGTAVTMREFQFAEGSYQVAAGSPARLVVHNSDGFVHDIAIPGLDVDPVTVLPGSDAVVDLPAASAGTYTIYCTLHSDPTEPDPQAAGMAALLAVR